MKKNAHIITHAHWDREWYMPFEYHRARLIDLVDGVINHLEKDKEFRTFHFDGQTIALEDYLEIKPYNKDKLKKLIGEGKICVGPWYILQDEFLTSSESNIRNLLVGMDIAKEFGKVTMLGYLPDAFGNAGQMPQIFSQAGIKAAVFGRGVKPTGAANQVFDFDSYKSQYSEMYWQSPDGSKVLGILFANWYANAKEMPTEDVRAWWQERIEKVEKYASTGELLFMNGCDHCPVQSGFDEAITEARKALPDYSFVHSSFEEYIDAVAKNLPEKLDTVYGELTGQDTSGWGNLRGTASTLTKIKYLNRKAEILLENVAEPLCVMAEKLGKEYPSDMLRYAWKSLMKNHPHDSICSCNCDEANMDVEARYRNAMLATDTIVNSAFGFITDKADKSAFADCKGLFAVANTYSKPLSGKVEVTVDTERLYGQQQLWQSVETMLNEDDQRTYVLVGENGNTIPAKIERLLPMFDYDLPDDGFRKSYIAKRYKVTFEATDVPAMGIKLYGIKEGEYGEKASLITSENVMENRFLKVALNPDGTVNITNKETGKTFDNLMKIEDVGDKGELYHFIPMEDYSNPIYSDSAKIELVCNEEYGAEFKITHTMEIPASADKQIEEDIILMRRGRKTSKRSEEKAILTIEKYISLEKNSRSLKVKCIVDNNSKDHRTRLIFPTGLNCDYHKAEAVFEMAKRPNRQKPTWEYPSETDRTQGVVSMTDGTNGLALTNIGMYEYEILKDNSIALTLLRCTGEIADWGYFPTEYSQCLGKTQLEFTVTPFANEAEALNTMLEIQYPMTSAQIWDRTEGSFAGSMLSFEGNMVRLTGIKKAENTSGTVVRFVSYSDKAEKIVLKKEKWMNALYKSNVVEDKGEEILPHNKEYTIEIKPYEILTVIAE